MFDFTCSFFKSSQLVAKCFFLKWKPPRIRGGEPEFFQWNELFMRRCELDLLYQQTSVALDRSEELLFEGRNYFLGGYSSLNHKGFSGGVLHLEHDVAKRHQGAISTLSYHLVSIMYIDKILYSDTLHEALDVEKPS